MYRNSGTLSAELGAGCNPATAPKIVLSLQDDLQFILGRLHLLVETKTRVLDNLFGTSPPSIQEAGKNGPTPPSGELFKIADTLSGIKTVITALEIQADRLEALA